MNEIRKVQNSYIYRQAKCPVCQHEFMYRKDIFKGYRIAGVDGFAYETNCTACREKLMLIDDVFIAVKREAIDESKIDSIVAER